MNKVLFAALLLAPRATQACAICFGATDTQSGFFTGLGYAIITLVAVVLSLVAGIGYAMYTVERDRARAEKKA